MWVRRSFGRSYAMLKFIIVCLSFLLVVMNACSPSPKFTPHQITEMTADSPGIGNSCESRMAQYAVPKSVRYLSESEASAIRTTLDTYGAVRLKPGGNYTSAPAIHIKSNYELYGLAGTQVPPIIIEQGTENSLVTGVKATNGITFESGPKPFRRNCIYRTIGTGVSGKDATLIENSFMDMSQTKIAFDNTGSGYLENNQFIRTMVHAASPSITLKGNALTPSTGNLFVWTNLLTPGAEGIVISNQKEIGFVGIDAESWNYFKKSTYLGMMNVSSTDFISIIMANGGDASQVGQYFNLDATHILIENMVIGKTANPGVVLGENVKQFVTINARDIGLVTASANTKTLELYKDKSPTAIENGAAVPTGISNEAQTALVELLGREKDLLNKFASPVFTDTAGSFNPNWDTLRQTSPGSSDSLQQLIDTQKILQLAPGTYYLDKPLVLKRGQGIIGAGINETILVAKSNLVDLIVAGDNFAGTTASTNFILADLTLQGGRNGINTSGPLAGTGAQFTLTTVSHVGLRNMSNAGILIDNVYGWDNNFFDFLSFEDNAVGIQQKTLANYTGGDQPGISYLDKNIFYRTSFKNNLLAIDWRAGRANNLNAFVSSRFIHNDKSIILLGNNSDFIFNSEIVGGGKTAEMISSNLVYGLIKSQVMSETPGATLLGENYFATLSHFLNFTAGSQLNPPAARNVFMISNEYDSRFNLQSSSGYSINNVSSP